MADTTTDNAPLTLVVSQPETVADVILTAAAAVDRSAAVAGG